MTGSLEEENKGIEGYIHEDVIPKGLLQSDALYQYILNTTVYPRESKPLKELRTITANHPLNVMTTPPEQGQFLDMLIKLVNAKNTIEIGVFTGYSLLVTALALPEDGKILAMDIEREDYEMGLPVIQKAGVAHKIDFRLGPALPLLDHLLADEKNQGTYDFVYVDADKDNYWNYHKRLISLVKLGGLICYDNTLWAGTVALPSDAIINKYLKHYQKFVLDFNKSIVSDPRVDLCQLPVGDGITLCRRIA